MAFYKPIRLMHPRTGNPLFIYIEEGTEGLIDRRDPGGLDTYLQDLYSKNDAIINRGHYQILILWNLEDTLMSDVWMFFINDDWDLPTNIDVANFSYTDVELNNGVTTGDGLNLLATEENLRLSADTIEQYVSIDRDFADGRIFNGQEYFA
jgi:hypothetical protein